VVLVIVPDVAQPNVAVDEELVRPPGADVKETRGAVDAGGGGGGGAEVTLHEYAALALPPEFDTVTRNECVPIARPVYDLGDVHATAVALSSEQVVVETVPVVDQPNDAPVDVVDDAGALVRPTVGAPVPALVTLQEYPALALPAEFDTVTRNECVPTARPVYDLGDAHATAVALSSEQLVVETVPVVDQPNDAVVDVVEDDGPLDRLTVGAVTPPEPESTNVPNSCDQ
jgi:hypothetical protein